MCEVIEYAYSDQRIFATAGAHGSRLPVRQRGGAVLMVRWGAQGRRFYDEPLCTRVAWSEEPYVPLAMIKKGAWAECQPTAVRIAVSRFMVYRHLDAVTLDHWIALRPGEYLQGALLRRGTEHAVYVVTVDPPAELSVVSPWPRIVTARKSGKSAV